MKTIKRHLLPTLLLLMAAVYSCKEINPFEGVNLVVNNEFFVSPMLIELVDANTENTLFPDNVVVKITGPGKDLVLDDTGGKNYKAVGNILSLVLANKTSPTEENPIEFTVEVSAPGYLATSQKFTIIGTEANRYQIAMVNLEHPPQGVVCKEERIAVNGGRISASENDKEVAGVQFESDTEIMDENGNTIDASSVETELVVFDATEQEALDAFPGGLVSEQVSFNNGGNEDIGFVSAGFVAINMEAGGTEVKQFSKPIEVNVVVSPSIQDPETGENLKEGSVIPTWSYSTETGEWAEEGTAVVSKNAQGELVATFYASHLSYWNLDFFYRLGPKCGRYYTDLQVSSNTESYMNGFYGYMYDGNGNYVTRNYMNVVNGSRSRIYNPRRSDLKIIVKDSEGNSYGETAVFDPCTQNNIPLNLTLPDPPESRDVAINFSANCGNQNVVLKPSAWVVLSGPTYGSWQYFYMSGGKANIRAEENLPYNVYMYYQGKLLGGTVTFSKDGSSATPFGSDGIVATTSYDASSNTIHYDAVYEVANCN